MDMKKLFKRMQDAINDGGCYGHEVYMNFKSPKTSLDVFAVHDERVHPTQPR